MSVHLFLINLINILYEKKINKPSDLTQSVKSLN